MYAHCSRLSGAQISVCSHLQRQKTYTYACKTLYTYIRNQTYSIPWTKKQLMFLVLFHMGANPSQHYHGL